MVILRERHMSPTRRVLQEINRPGSLARQDSLQAVRQEAHALFGEEAPLDTKIFRGYQDVVLKSIPYYLNPEKQAYKSDHNAEHAITVLSISLLMVEHLKKENPAIQLDADAIILGAVFHDSQRKGDIWESIADIQGHGERAAQKLDRKVAQQLLGKPLDDRTVAIAQEICRYHDDEGIPKNPSKELAIVASADRATLPRILFSYHKFVGNAGKLTTVYPRIIKRRAEEYAVQIAEDEDPLREKYQKLIHEFLFIGTVLCHITRERVGDNFTIQHQFDSVGKALQEMGLLQ